MNRNQRVAIANDTLDVLKKGHYTSAKGVTISIESDLRKAIARTELIRPDDWPALLRQYAALRAHLHGGGAIEVTGETSLEAAQRLSAVHTRLLCLNFASAKNAGGGFLGGSQAQEESLARSSGLYACIEPQREYYETNRHCGTCLYTDYALYSPQVPVFRNDAGDLLDPPYNCSFFTAPAPNAGAVRSNEPQRVGEIESVLRRRIEQVLAWAAIKDYEALVLGAWGCGVFQNDPELVARLFAEVLQGHAFRQIVFAVYDSSADKNVLRAFERALGV